MKTTKVFSFEGENFTITRTGTKKEVVAYFELLQQAVRLQWFYYELIGTFDKYKTYVFAAPLSSPLPIREKAEWICRVRDILEHLEQGHLTPLDFIQDIIDRHIHIVDRRTGGGVKCS